MSEAAEYRAHGDKMLQLALRTQNVIEQGHLISLAAHWHMKAAALERGLPAEPEFLADLDFTPDQTASPENNPDEQGA